MYSVMENTAPPPLYLSNPYRFWLNGIFLVLVGLVGITGNTAQIVLFCRKTRRRCFHGLLFLLAVFDSVLILCNIWNHTLPALSRHVWYSSVWNISLQMSYPCVNIGQMASLYGTMALAAERFLTVCYPFWYRRGLLKPWKFILPVIIISIVFNFPRFFELTTRCMDPEKSILFIGSAKNSTEGETATAGLQVCGAIEFRQFIETPVRRNSYYRLIYMNILDTIFNIFLPFSTLFFLNCKIYKKLKDFCTTVTMIASREIRSSQIQKRKKEVNLSRISLWINAIVLLCHMINVVPKVWELIAQPISGTEMPFLTFCLKSVARICITLSCSMNFYVYYYKHGRAL